MLRPPLSFRPKRGVKRRAERRNLSHCTIVFAMYICPCSIPSPYCHPARSFDFAPCYSLGASLRMTACTAFYAACLKRSLTTACRRCRVPRERCPLRHIPATFRCIMFREQVLLHCSAHSADSRDVILSRRACDASKNLLRFPQSSCSAIVSASPPLSFRPKRGVKRRAERRNLSHCTHVFAMYICPCSIPSPYCHPCKILRLRAFLFARHFAQDDRTCGQAACRRRGVPAAMFRESGGRSAIFRQRSVASCSANRCYCIALLIPRPAINRE